MKKKYRKLLASGIAVTAAGVIGAEALLQTSVSVQASAAMMPGIEQQIDEKISEEKPFRILEIVDNKIDAEIGYYVGGQEPFLKLYEYNLENEDGTVKTIRFSSVDEALSVLPSEKLRREFYRKC